MASSKYPRLADYGTATYPQLATLCKLLDACTFFNIDIETNGLNFVRRRVVSIGITVAGKNFAIECWRYDITFLVVYLKDAGKKKYVHNGLFDFSFLGWLFGDIYIAQNIEDTMINERLIKGIGGLATGVPKELKGDKSIAAEYSDSLKDTLPRYGFAMPDKELQTSFVWGKDLTREQTRYMHGDTSKLHKLAALQRKVQPSQPVADLENEALEAFVAMRVRGFAFDTDLWIKGSEEDEREYEKAVQKLNKATGNAVANWNSPVQVKKYFASQGIVIESLTDIKGMRGKHKALDMLIDLRDGLLKNVTTYGKSWLTVNWHGSKKGPEDNEPTVGPDGRIHPDFNQIVSTGRGSCSKPNLQNLPGYGPRRRSFRATKGHKLVAPDFTGQELAIMAVGSGEASWINDIENDRDIHSVMAAEYFFTDIWKKGKEKTCVYPKKCSCKVHKPIRDKSKRFNFGVPYGKKAPTIALDLGISRYQADILLKIFEQSKPKLATWLAANGQHAIDHYEAYTLPPFRRYRNLKLERAEWHRRNQGYNTPIQGTGADMIKLSMVLALRWLKAHPKFPAYLLLWVHDELITEVEEKYATQWAEVLKGIMEEAAMIILGRKLIKSEPKIMDYWEPKDEN
jgi:DNA polymerase I-like protein with 3'-5' exonuclease and polymerase domains